MVMNLLICFILQLIINKLTRQSKRHIIFFLIIIIGPRYLVVSDAGVVGDYLDLKKAKQKLMTISDGDRIIAYVDSLGQLSSELKKIADILQDLSISPVAESVMYKLLNVAGEYLQNFQSKLEIKVCCSIPKC